MQSRHLFLHAAAIEGEPEIITDAEPGLLTDVFRMLPHGVTVQDEQGRFLLVNAAAAAQLRMAAAQQAPSQELERRQAAGRELLRAGETAVTEECIGSGPGKQTFLTTHRPVRIAERNLLLTSSADISAQKAFEDQLFRSAYYDELTDLPTR
ncbi:MAG: diguanylate cyclase, partial [Bradyrhizobium sp.]